MSKEKKIAKKAEHMISNEERNKLIFEEGKKYLLCFSEINKKILNNQLRFPEENKPTTKNQLFKKMMHHAKNRRQMPNVIGDVERLENILYGFDSNKVLERYNNWEKIFDRIARDENFDTPREMKKDSKHNSWVIFCKSIISIAQFLHNFDDIYAFNDYVNQFLGTEDGRGRLELPLILKKNIFGYGFALACDFIKENISPEFIKPDRHIKDIFIGIGLSRKDSSDFQIFCDVIKYSNSIKEIPYTVDKLFWLIGSGNFHRSGITIDTDKNKFIEHIKKNVRKRNMKTT
jgi:hypothetical protein